MHRKVDLTETTVKYHGTTLFPSGNTSKQFSIRFKWETPNSGCWVAVPEVFYHWYRIQWSQINGGSCMHFKHLSDDQSMRSDVQFVTTFHIIQSMSPWNGSVSSTKRIRALNKYWSTQRHSQLYLLCFLQKKWSTVFCCVFWENATKYGTPDELHQFSTSLPMTKENTKEY